MNTRTDVKTGRSETIPGLENAGCGIGCANIALSHNGRDVYYVRTVPATSEHQAVVSLIRHSLADGQEKVIYQTDGPILHSPAVSPDDRQIAFGENKLVKIGSADGGRAREVFNGSAFGIVWTPDGRRLLLRGDLGDGKVQVLSVPVTGGVPVPTGIETGIWLALHPDGRRVAYTDSEDRTEVVAVRNLFAGQKGGK